MYSINYEDINKKDSINIFGIEFNIDEDIEKYIKELEEIKYDDKDNEKIILFNKILGENAYTEIDDKMKKDNQGNMNSNMIYKILGFVASKYAEMKIEENLLPINTILNNANEKLKNVTDGVENISKITNNRNYNRNYNGNNYRRNYRRY